MEHKLIISMDDVATYGYQRARELAIEAQKQDTKRPTTPRRFRIQDEPILWQEYQADIDFDNYLDRSDW